MVIRIFLYGIALFIGSISYADILFVGDTHFGENYQYSPRYNKGVNIIDEQGYDIFFENVKHVLKDREAVIANLETPLVSSPENPVSYYKPYLHWSDPAAAPVFLAKYNIKYVSLGNNHVFDYGERGYNQTVLSLQTSGIVWFGAGSNDSAAIEPLLTKAGGKTLIVFGGFEYRQKYDTLFDFYASQTKPGVNKLDTLTMNLKIKEYRLKYPEAIIVIYPHWGANYKPAGTQLKAMAHSYINAGADVVIGHGAHTVQEAELYNGKWIFYNIGNFIFNARGRYGSTGAKPYGMMISLNFTASDVRPTIYPLYTNNKESDYCLRLLDDDELDDCAAYVFGDSKYHVDYNAHSITPGN
ncbi:MAG TPA: CapA family protein [Ignavibacteria bacterium]|nr:CapA family protein [Ignavibacteria bacterium]